MFFTGLLIPLWWLAGVSAAFGFLVILVWLWPERGLGQTARTEHG
jgi:hypothetical protein